MENMPVIWLAMRRITVSRWHLLKMKMPTIACTGNHYGAETPHFLLGTAFFFHGRTKKKARKKKSNGQLL